jgi:hypothetical protein
MKTKTQKVLGNILILGGRGAKKMNFRFDGNFLEEGAAQYLYICNMKKYDIR